MDNQLPPPPLPIVDKDDESREAQQIESDNKEMAPGNEVELNKGKRRPAFNLYLQKLELLDQAYAIQFYSEKKIKDDVDVEAFINKASFLGSNSQHDDQDLEKAKANRLATIKNILKAKRYLLLLWSPLLPSTQDIVSLSLSALCTLQMSSLKDEESPKGSLLFSFTIEREDGRVVPLVQYVVCLAMTEAIKDLALRNGIPPLNVRIKWPNYLYLDGLKVEMPIRKSVISLTNNQINRRGRSYSRTPSPPRHGRSRSPSRSRSYSRSRSPVKPERSTERAERRSRSPRRIRASPPPSKGMKRNPSPEDGSLAEKEKEAAINYLDGVIEKLRDTKESRIEEPIFMLLIIGCRLSTIIYKSALLYLAYTSVESLSDSFKLDLAFDLSLSALLGENVYNFGELLAHPIVESARDKG
ncbi:biotin--protein ligase 2-like protein isoform X1 [Tanacetum coccineum]